MVSPAARLLTFTLWEYTSVLLYDIRKLTGNDAVLVPMILYQYLGGNRTVLISLWIFNNQCGDIRMFAADI